MRVLGPFSASRPSNTLSGPTAETSVQLTLVYLPFLVVILYNVITVLALEVCKQLQCLS